MSDGNRHPRPRVDGDGQTGAGGEYIAPAATPAPPLEESHVKVKPERDGAKA